MKAKPFALLTSLLLCLPLAAQSPGTVRPSCIVSQTITATGRYPVLNIGVGGTTVTGYNNVTPLGTITTGCTNWTFAYSSVGFSAVTIEVDTAPDGGATIGASPGSWTIWPATQIAAGQSLPLTATTNAGVTLYGPFPWLSVNVTTLTGTGQLAWILYGWQTQGSQESNTGATQVQGVTAPGTAPSGNPIQIALNAPTKPWDCALSALAASLTQCQAAPAAGRLYITDITVDTTTATAGTYLVEYGTGSNCGTGTTKLYPSANGPAGWTAPVLGAPQKINFTVPLQPAALNAICVLGTVTNTINIELDGFVAQ